jgi:GTP-binding protein EngB required for normal cell division
VSPPGDAGPLARLGALAAANGLTSLVQEAAELAERVVEGRTYVAVVGQFKRGKSSLINALTGHRAVPTGVVPVTRVPTVIRHGELAARVRLGTEWRTLPPDELARYVTEDGNPGNRLGVVGAEVFVPSPLLADGLSLVDTPGLGSIEPGASVATSEVLPRVDAALLLLGADAPITADELALARTLLDGGQPVLIVLGKGDRASAEDRAAIRAYTERALGRGADLFVVSAMAEPGSSGNPDWSSLVEALRRLSRDEGRTLLAASAERGARRLAVRIGQALREERDALLRPAAESAARAVRAELTESTALRALADLTPLLRADVERLRTRAESDTAAFLRHATGSADAELRVRAARLRRPEALAAANALARERLAPWFEEMERSVARSFDEVAARFRASCEGLLRSAGDGVADDASADLAAAVATLGARHFHFHDRLRTRAAASSLLDRWLPRGMAERRGLAAARRYLADLLEVNASRAEGDVAERARESAQAFEGAVRRALTRVTEVTRDAARRARVAQQAGEREVARRVEALDRALEELGTPAVTPAPPAPSRG